MSSQISFAPSKVEPVRCLCFPRARFTYTGGESLAGTDKEPNADGATDGDHAEMALRHCSIELDETAPIVPHSEGSKIETMAGHEGFVLDGFGGVLWSVVTAVS